MLSLKKSKRRRGLSMNVAATLLVAVLAVPASAHCEVIRLHCVDTEYAGVASLAIDTDSRRIEQMLGNQLVELTASQITDANVHYYDDVSGKFRISRSLNRASGELLSEPLNGPRKGMASYWACTALN